MTQLSIQIDPDAGASPYTISGNPVQALIAQLNRFAGKSLSLGPTCGSAVYLRDQLPLDTNLSYAAALYATNLFYDRFNCVNLELESKQKLTWITANTQGDPTPFIMANLREITISLAQVGDSLGLPPAVVGITKVDPKVKPKSYKGLYIAGGILLATGGIWAAINLKNKRAL